MSNLITNIEHDNLWRDVMGKQIPNATGYLKRLIESQTAIARMTFYKEALRYELITEDQFKELLKTDIAELLYLSWKD